MSRDSNDEAPRGVDGVEIKVTLGAETVDDGLAAFALDADAAEQRRIWFCEHVTGGGPPRALPLLGRGLILRVRKRKDHADDATLKVRGPEGCIDPRLWHERTRALGEQARLEGDWMGDRHLVSASLDSDVEGGQIDEVLSERPHRVQRLFSDAQAALTTELLLRLDGLELLGPVVALKWAPGTAGLDDDVAAELWEVNDRLRFLELSIRVEQDPAAHQRHLEDSVRDRRLDIAREQETKTRMVLEHFAAAAAGG